MRLPYENRTQAGAVLAQALSAYREQPGLLVLALPRGGLPVGLEVARSLKAELDLILVRKLGAPGQEELAMGAIASGGAKVLNRDIVRALNVSDETIERAVDRESLELRRREELYRGKRERPHVEGRTIIVVDDGLATGATMRAAVSSLRAAAPARVVVAVPVAPPSTVDALRTEADEVVCPATPEPFLGVGRWYRDFAQISDDEVRACLREAWQPEFKVRQS